MQQNQNYYQNNGQYTGSPYQAQQQPIHGQQYQQPGFQPNPQGPIYNPNLSNNSNNYQYQNPMMPKEKSLIYHYIFSVYLMLNAGSSLISLFFSGIASLFEYADLWVMFFVYIPAILVALYNFITGFSLLKRGRAGYLMQKISNIYTLITGGLYCLIVTPLLIIGYSDISAVSEETQIFMAIGLILLIILIPVLIIDLCTLIYYNKRKHMFGKKKIY